MGDSSFVGLHINDKVLDSELYFQATRDLRDGRGAAFAVLIHGHL